MNTYIQSMDVYDFFLGNDKRLTFICVFNYIKKY
jgi:hypothetical protein